ncbi:MAG: carbohydrate kinase family protein [Candidatus Sumerlaeaceae bacterium]
MGAIASETKHGLRPLNVLTVADMCVDLVMTGNVVPQFGQVEQLVDNYELCMGGSACIFAAQFARLGGRVAVIGKVGPDSFGDLAVNTLTAAGVDVSWVRRDPELKTGIGVALDKGDDRAILTYLGSIDAVLETDITDELEAMADHWHLASIFLLQSLRHTWQARLRRLRETGVTVSFDPNWDPDNKWDTVHELLPYVDVFLPNENEAYAISGTDDYIAAGRRLAKLCPLVVIKRGEHGAAAFRGQEQFNCVVSGMDDITIMDAVGAGDSFDGGFVRAWQLGKPIEDCLRLGIKCGCESLRGSGGTQSQFKAHIE